jgi:hypothetical protein
MRNFFILGATLAVTACGGVSNIGFGHEHLDGGGETGGANAGGASSSGGKTGSAGKATTGGHANGGSPSTGGNSSTETGGMPNSGGKPNSGGYPSSGGGTGHAGAGGCTGVINCPLIPTCPAGEVPVTPPGECCPTGCAPSGAGGSTGVGCKSAGECAVPAICKLCPDGSSSCATGACVNGQCTTTFPACPSPVDAGTGLKWFATCGPPVCRQPPTPTGAPVCDPTKGQAVGDACTTQGATCDPGAACSGNLLCTTKDPKSSVGGCPISRAKYKEDIRYLSGEERSKLAEDLQSIPLVRYRYKDGPEREHLGFIIEDIEPSPSVDSQHDQVDLYGYTSMAVAALQQQHAEIQALKEEVRALKAALARSKRAK